MDFLIHHLLRSSALNYPEKEALVHGEQRLSYAEVAKQTAGLAYGLRKIGLQRGDRIGIYLEPSVPQVLSIFGISQAGGVFVPINTLLFPEQVAHIASDCRMKGLITTNSKLSSLAPALKELSSLEFLVVLPDAEPANLAIPSHNFEDLCQLLPPETWADVSIEVDLAALLYTSGSTGKPKGVMLNHAQIIAGSSIVSNYLSITAADRILAVLPFSFDAGLNQLITAFEQGSTIVLMTFSFAREITQMLLKEEITALAGVPTLWSLLSRPSSSIHKHQFPHLRYITNTGGAMPQNVLASLRELLPTTQIFLMYGLTEAFRSTYLPPTELDRRPTSIGKAIPNTEILVVNEQGKLCQPGEVGELVHRGPTVSMGYWGKPDLTAHRLRPHPLVEPELMNGEKVCYSGDLVKTDEEGFLYFVSRRDTMIKSSGFRISPTEVEEVLMQSGFLQGAAVIAIPDEVLGQAIKALVVAKEEVSLDTDALLTFCREQSPHYMVPKVVEVLDELPKTTSGKVDYPALRRREKS
ncbi:MAG: acyl-CoA ligase (AMP-forming), exosortase A system-associated [Symploca sp. SIO1C2]|nr:acyl-CoA ligase (AMP-forming), exosortase A system-associated [Symploca sp. SIO1C2]